MVLKGQMLANAYIRSFTGFALLDTLNDEDTAIRFLLPTCAPGTRPADGGLCWMDGRDILKAAQQCIPRPPTVRKRRAHARVKLNWLTAKASA